MAQLTDEDRKEFWRSGVGVFAKILFKGALAAFLLPIAVTILFVAMENPNINGIGIGIGLLISALMLVLGIAVTIIGLATYRKKETS